MSSPLIEEQMRKIHAYVSRVMNDPALLQRNRVEFDGIVDLWKQLHRTVPNIVKISAEEFKRSLIAQANGPAHERMAFASKVLNAPTAPGFGPSQQQLQQYQRDLGKYNRMFEMYSKIMANAHEMKKSLIQNFPR